MRWPVTRAHIDGTGGRRSVVPPPEHEPAQHAAQGFALRQPKTANTNQGSQFTANAFMEAVPGWARAFEC
ncbi:hypothetical protein SAMN04487769_2539 [Burkholderia sp. b14]|nr:hypothetical protein SAMN04487769_2539 [Burkholderia sp. b14]